MRLMPLWLVLVALPVAAANPQSDPKPEIVREVATAQAIGAAHTVRTIPEACVHLLGKFTGDPEQAYAFTAVPTSARCQPRARLVDAAKVQPSLADGWIFNDLIRIPSAACLSRQAVVRIWRKPADAVPPALDAQGRARIYMDESELAPDSSPLAQLPLYAAEVSLEGQACD